MNSLKTIFSRSFPAILIISLGILIYSNTFQNPFIFDDEVFITENLSIRNISDVKTIMDYLNYSKRFITFLLLFFELLLYAFIGSGLRGSGFPASGKAHRTGLNAEPVNAYIISRL